MVVLDRLPTASSVIGSSKRYNGGRIVSFLVYKNRREVSLGFTTIVLGEYWSGGIWRNNESPIEIIKES